MSEPVAAPLERAPRMVVGIVGLGIMGSAFAANLRKAGFEVVGFDIAPAAGAALNALGGAALGSPEAVAQRADVVLLALASVDALNAAVTGESGLAQGLRPGVPVVEMGTLPLAAKETVRDLLEAQGNPVLDCPVSGTGAQAQTGDLVLYASGDAQVVERLRPVFDAFARSTRFVGPFGAGTRLKFVANLLVTIHNLASAEALLLAERSGLDPALVYDAIRDGAGTSRIFEVRGPLMIAERYQPASMKMAVYMKDLALIGAFARETGTPTPLLDAAIPFYEAAMAAGRQEDDPAALFAVLKDIASDA